MLASLPEKCYDREIAQTTYTAEYGQPGRRSARYMSAGQVKQKQNSQASYTTTTTNDNDNNNDELLATTTTTTTK